MRRTLQKIEKCLLLGREIGVIGVLKLEFKPQDIAIIITEHIDNDNSYCFIRTQLFIA